MALYDRIGTGHGEMRLYAMTIFLSAFLLFQVEPMIAKYILPWFGGTQAVWTTCLLFFQMLLLSGYAYSHLIGTKLPPRRQAIVQLTLVFSCVVAMGTLALLWKSPIMPGVSWKPAAPDLPIPRILLVLSVSIGLPYFVLSTTAPLLQAWFARIHKDRSPYRLYSVSNLGALLALLSYPFVVEPRLDLKAQTDVWFGLYVLFAIGMGLGATAALNIPAQTPPPRDRDACNKDVPIDRLNYLLWISLAACASLMLYAVTSLMTRDVAPIPFLWILPLAIYLASFIVCFDNERWYRRGVFHPILAIAIFLSFTILPRSDRIAMSFGHLMLAPESMSLLIQIAGLSLLLLAVCMVCHGELVRLKPHARDLTAFYLMVSIGGALGGVFAVVIAPAIFKGYWEYGLAVWTCAALLLLVLVRDRESWLYESKPAAALLLVAATLALPELMEIPAITTHAPIYNLAAVTVVGLMAVITLQKTRPRFLDRPGILTQCSMAAAILVVGATYVGSAVIAPPELLMVERNFYGVFRVLQYDGVDADSRVYRLKSGDIMHGEQFPSPKFRYYPTAYYGPYSGIGLLLMNYPRRSDEFSEDSPLRIGVVGLGVGTIAAWGRRGDYIRFYEINPAIIDIATDPNGYFSYIRDSSAKVEIVPGDARLSMEREVRSGHAQDFDVLAIDAFNGDAIPVHLLTREAMQIYLPEVKADGVIAFHVTNRYLDLVPVLVELSRAVGLRCGWVRSFSTSTLYEFSDWVLLARNDRVLGDPEIARHLQPLGSVRKVRLWTNEYSNLFQILR